METVTHILEALHELNRVQIRPPASFTKLSKKEQARQIDALRGQLPTAILGHHDRRIATGQKSLAVVRKGICGVFLDWSEAE